MIDRQEALHLLTTHIDEKNLINHSIQTEAVLSSMARELGRDADMWGLTGLLHDLDYGRTKDKPEQHGLISADLLAGKLPDEALQAIRSHNGERNGFAPDSELDFALRCGESVTGLISANALVRPQGMEGMKPKSLKKKMKDKSFAASVSRENIKECERVGLELSRFLALSIAAIQDIADQVDLT